MQDFFSEIFRDSKTEISDPSPPAAHSNATALPPAERSCPQHVRARHRWGGHRARE